MHRRGAKVVIALGDAAGGQRIDARVSMPAFCGSTELMVMQTPPLTANESIRLGFAYDCIPIQVASRIVEAAQTAGASQLVLVSPSGGGGGGGLFGGFLGGGGSSSAVEQACLLLHAPAGTSCVDTHEQAPRVRFGGT